MDDYFSIRNLKIDYKTFDGEKNVLDIERLSIQKGETFGVVGESGVGKTVLALTILKLLAVPPGVISRGQILFHHEDLLAKKEKEMQKIRGKKISLIFQDPMSTLNPVFTVGEQITEVIRHHQGLNKKEAAKKAGEMLDLVKLPDAGDIMKKYPHELSGGQRQRVIIAIALSCGAELMIADEPTRNLDVTIQAGILRLIKDLQRQLNITIIFIANNLGLVSAVCERVAILYRGKIVEMGTVEEVLHKPLHPYTAAFINAIPKKDEQLMERKHFSSHDEEADSQTCPYYHVCAEKKEECKLKAVKLELVMGTHYASCLKAGKEVR
ncbi:ABC transporter ATP-binding protein [Candidatus Formimonas warabiya]|uniref:Dipeptide/oligopeptide/nickel ABC transporter ATP-binding protein n=1 Tax=Formimonas warabiya TaxID=1761012 RepID=A0A3G1KRB1_FORW1|nr:ABC transporter ATP-binding protein [Candidatus Formimonas warabiya]ATW24645.1 dipeptide/oligopeptide/nickel ABC transporter ATP-binding protein [Candidatus Formimonas warabiya]